MLNLTENLYGTMILNGVGAGQGVVGNYTMSLDLSDLDASWWNADGHNNISFMVESVTPWMLGLQANDVTVIGTSTNPYAHPYGIVAGFNYFSGDIQYSNGIISAPEPETWAMLLAGLGIVGITAKRRRLRKS